MNSEDKQLFQQALCGDIEVLLEEFEEDTGNQVSEIKVSRLYLDKKQAHKAFEYIVEVKCRQ